MSKPTDTVATLTIATKDYKTRMLVIDFTCMKALERRKAKLQANNVPFTISTYPKVIYEPDRT